MLKKHVHRVPSGTGTARLEAAAARYAAHLASAALSVPTQPGTDSRAPAGPTEDPVAVPRFDVVMLGVGPDGHVASLFPGRPELQERVRATLPVSDSPKPPPDRVSLTIPALNTARAVWLVVSGADKADAVRQSLAAASGDGRPDGADPLPAARVTGTQETVWWVDEAAAPAGADGG